MNPGQNLRPGPDCRLGGIGDWLGVKRSEGNSTSTCVVPPRLGTNPQISSRPQLRLGPVCQPKPASSSLEGSRRTVVRADPFPRQQDGLDHEAELVDEVDCDDVDVPAGSLAARPPPRAGGAGDKRRACLPPFGLLQTNGIIQSAKGSPARPGHTPAITRQVRRP
jgi:hypothetical protein